MVELYGGIEGGTTNSRMVILNSKGIAVGKSEGPHTNHWYLGMDETAKRISNLTLEALKDANLPENTTLKVLGLSLSGVDTVEIASQVINAVQKYHPNIAEKLHASNDSVGTWATATDQAAIVLIAGTGSICKLMHDCNKYSRFGGLGHLLGDEGSAFWIAREAIILFIKSTEGLIHSQFSIVKLQQSITKHFNIKHHHEILPYFNEKFDKKFIAQLCKSLANAANEGDLLCKQIFQNAGIELGRHVRAAVRQAKKEHLMGSEGLDVICCGSVFKSWDLLEKGFCIGLQPHHSIDCSRGRLNINLLQVTAAYGAAMIAAEIKCELKLPRPQNAYKRITSIDLSEQDLIRQP